MATPAPIRAEMRRRADAVDRVSDDARAIIERAPVNIARRLAAAYGIDPDTVTDADGDMRGLPGETRVESEIRREEGNDPAQRAATLRLTPADFQEFVRSAGVDAARSAWIDGAIEFTPEGLTPLQREAVREAIGVDADALFDRIATDYSAVTNRTVTQAALRGILTDDALRPAISSLPDTLPSGGHDTEIITATARIDRIAQAQNRARLQQGGAVLMVYTGPDDKKTRPFCDAIVGKAFTPEQVAEMDNGQTGAGSVESEGGGYRCRHGWVTIDAADAADLGVEMGGSADVSAANGAARKARGRR